MRYHKTFQTPNELVDAHLSSLKASELKILLYIIRQTYGWKLKNGKHKQRDRITYNLFHQKTGVAIRTIPTVIQSLINQKLITVTNYQGDLLNTPDKRKGKTCIYYAPCFTTYAKENKKVCRKYQKPMQKMIYNKTNHSKLNKQKGYKINKKQSDWQRISEIMNNRT